MIKIAPSNRVITTKICSSNTPRDAMIIRSFVQ
jgi:hypothetical protein